MPFFFIILIFPVKSHAIFSFIGTQIKKGIELSSYLDAAAELSAEISPDRDLENSALELRRRTENLRRELSDINTFSQTTQSILKGPDWSSNRIDTNIKNTTDYIRRLKKLVISATALGSEGVIALNTTETNVALNEIQKNQQAIIMQNSDAKLREIEREHEETKQWKMFTATQSKIRKRDLRDGKF